MGWSVLVILKFRNYPCCSGKRRWAARFKWESRGTGSWDEMATNDSHAKVFRGSGMGWSVLVILNA
jgi:hypothetical protein